MTKSLPALLGAAALAVSSAAAQPVVVSRIVRIPELELTNAMPIRLCAKIAGEQAACR